MTPFDRIEAAQEYLALLSDTAADNRQSIEAEISNEANQEFQRRLEVLRLVSYQLEKLEKHLKASRQTLNNLRKLRHLVLRECTASAPVEEKVSEVPGIEALNFAP